MTKSQLLKESAELVRVLEMKKKKLKTAEISMKAQFNGDDPTVEAVIKRIEIRHRIAEIKELEDCQKRIMTKIKKMEVKNV